MSWLTRLMSADTVIIVLVATAGFVYAGARLVHVRRHGASVRDQVLLGMVLTTAVLTVALSAVLLLAEVAGLGWSSEPVATRVAVRLLPQIAFLVLVLSGAAALSAMVLGRVLAEPLERLTEASLRVAAGERQATLPLPRGKEVRELTRAFESMRRELEQRHMAERFAADLSHELKNPVASIRASAEVLEDAIGEDEEAARRFARRIQEATGRLEGLTHDLLELTRLEAAGLADPEAAVDLVAVVRGAVGEVRPLALEGEVEIQVDLPDQVRAHGDASWLRRAVVNLLSNAVSFSPAGAVVRVDLGGTREAWELQVVDSGPGVEPSVRDRVFERFVGARHGQGGTGLGLAIVRAVAEAHGGAVELRSTSEQGSRFALVLPRG